MLNRLWFSLIICLVPLYITTVYPARENGSYCKKDRKCLSQHCCITRCRECCTHSQCNKGQECRGNVCQGPKPNGHTCLVHSDCRTSHCCGPLGEKICRDCCGSSHCSEGEKCRENGCVGFLASGMDCKEDFYCDSNHCCRNGKCGDCCMDNHCNSAANETCLLRTCTGPRDVGVRCSQDSDCQSSSCCGSWLRNNKACQECCEDDDCNEGLNCFNNVCSGPRQNTEVCLLPSHCSSSNCCRQKTGNSTLKFCSECCRDSNCDRSQTCNQWNLCGKAIPSLCSQNIKCSPGKYCSNKGVCEKQLRNKTPCKQDEQCASSSCCGIVSLGRKCEQCCKDEDCKTSQTCTHRRCEGLRQINKQCQKHTQCGSGRCCSINPSSPLSFKYCSYCCQDKDCPGRQTCSGRKCLYLPEVGTSCRTRAARCQTTHCCGAGVVSVGSCQECCTHNQCMVGMRCRKKKCVPE